MHPTAKQSALDSDCLEVWRMEYRSCLNAYLAQNKNH